MLPGPSLRTRCRRTWERVSREKEKKRERKGVFEFFEFLLFFFLERPLERLSKRKKKKKRNKTKRAPLAARRERRNLPLRRRALQPVRRQHRQRRCADQRRRGGEPRAQGDGPVHEDVERARRRGGSSALRLEELEDALVPADEVVPPRVVVRVDRR